MNSVERGIAIDRWTLPIGMDPSARIACLRLISAVVLVATLWLWSVRATGRWDPAALALLAAMVAVYSGVGAAIAGALGRVIAFPPGLAFDFLLGFFFTNTALFGLVLVTPFGIAWDATLLGVGAVAIAVAPRRRRAPTSLRAEAGSLACIALTAVFATVWVSDQQPIMTAAADRAVFRVWTDVYLHVGEISAFSQSHGAGSLSDIKLWGIGAPAYHFASYMPASLLNAVTTTTAIDSYAALMLPFGLLLTGLASYVLVAIVLRTVWPAVFASAILIAAPDAYQQGFGIRYLSFSFMSQVNLGMLYGLSCIALGWSFMIEGCRQGRVAGLVAAYVLLTFCLGYKAHLVVANALVLMLYPCLFFGTFSRRQRVVAAVAAVVLFVAVAHLSQSSSRVPTLRLDGSGLREYVDILMTGFHAGVAKGLFVSTYYGHHWPRPINVALVGALILAASFGLWVILAPAVLWRARGVIDARIIAFVVLVAVNYQIMSMFLALDERGVGSSEELLNRPHAWAWFVVVTMTCGIGAYLAWGNRVPSVRVRWATVAMLGLLLLTVRLDGHELQTSPEWPGRAHYEDFNTAPTCLLNAALELRARAAPREVFVDSDMDPRLFVAALSERPSYVSDDPFGGHREIVRARVADVRTMLMRADAAALEDWAAQRHVSWLLMRPASSDGWDAAFLDRAVYRCDGYRLFSLKG